MSESWRKELKKLIAEKEKADQSKNYKKIALYCESIGRLLFENGFIKESIEQFEEQAQIFMRQNKKLDLAKTYHIISDVYADSGDLELSLKFALKYNNISRDEGSFAEIQRATATLGRIYYLMACTLEKEHERHDYLKKSLEFYNLSQSTVETLCGTVPKNEIVEMRACLYLNTAILYEEWNQIEQAEIKYRACASLSQQCQSRDTELKALIGLSTLKYKRFEFDDALLCMYECLRCTTRTKDKSLVIVANILHGKIKLGQAKFEESVQIFKNCYQNIHLTTDNLEEFKLYSRLAIHGMYASRQISSASSLKIRALLFHKIGKILYKCESYKLALKYFTDELNTINNNKMNDNDVLSVYKSIGDCNFYMNNYDEAIIYYNRCVSLTKDDFELSNIHLKLGNTKEKLNFCFNLVYDSYNQAYQHASNTSVVYLKYIIMNNIKNLQEKHCKSELLKKTQTIMNDMDSCFSEPESECVVSDIDIEEEFEKFTDAKDQQRTTIKVMPKKLTANPNRKNDLGETLLHVACMKGHKNRVVELIENGADVHIRDFCGWLPLHEASNHGHVDIVEILLNHGSFINDRGGINCGGVTPLIDAADNLHLDVVKLLLDRGADPSIADDQCRTILSVLIEKVDTIGHDERKQLNEIIKIIRSRANNVYICPINKPTEEHPKPIKKSKRLDAISDDRIPLLVAASTYDKNSPNSKFYESSIIDSKGVREPRISDENTVSRVCRQNRKRITVISSDEETLDHTFDSTDRFEDAQTFLPLPHSFVDNNSFIHYKIILKDENRVLSCNLDASQNSLAINLIKEINKVTQKSDSEYYNIFLIDSNSNLIFPYMDLNHVYLNNMNIECYEIAGLTSTQIYTKICSTINEKPLKRVIKYLCEQDINESLGILSITRFTRVMAAFYYTLLAISITRLDFSYTQIYDNDYFDFISNILPYFNNLSYLSFKNADLSLIKLQKITNFCENSPFLLNLTDLDMSFNCLNDDATKLSEIILKFAVKCPNLCRLYVSYCQIEDLFDPSFSLMSYMQENSKLTTFDISGNILPESQLKNMLNNFLPWNKYDSICLSNISTSYDILLPFSFFIKMSKCTVLRLNISNNNCSHSFFSLFSSPDFLQNIVELNISNTNMDSSSIFLIRKEFSKFASLQSLLMFDNPECFSSFDELFYFINSSLLCKSLLYLDLSNTVTLNIDSDCSLSPPVSFNLIVHPDEIKLSKINPFIFI